MTRLLTFLGFLAAAPAFSQGVEDWLHQFELTGGVVVRF